MIKKLELDVYIEDNYDIVNYLSQKNKIRILWIYNIFDRGIAFIDKFPSLKSAVMSIFHE